MTTLRRWPTTLAALAVTALLPTAHADTFNEDFNGATVSPLLAFSSSTPGITFANEGGWGVFTKADGVGNGFGYLRSTFQLVGDFSVSVSLLRDGLIGQGEAGLDLRFFSTYPKGFADVWSQDIGTMVANTYLPAPPGLGSTSVHDTAALPRLMAVRSGNTLQLGYSGSTMQSFTAPELAGPVTVELFLGQEAGNTVGHRAMFDNLAVRGTFAAAPVPEPASWGLLGAGLAMLCTLSARRSQQARCDGSAA